MALQVITSTEPIPGYRVSDRIGSGGYGEVWKADAPGGLTKAIKFIYGYLDEDRATRELKALNRIRGVRHPFLLSLERIEVVDGQLLIVTELAEGSLKDRFDECIRAGMPGIPRDELLGYIRDAADALDYMSETHSLQHLDVKPENLLLLAGRVKVADFGLVKDIHDVTCSLMGGLTPVYAPPEVFDGRPSRFSDQYSLAIVFQEMLTGSVPFPGKTAAQLAKQHLSARPRLLSLAASDQAIIGRALSKEPEDRFANCRAMVEALFNPDRAAGGDAGIAALDRHDGLGTPESSRLDPRLTSVRTVAITPAAERSKASRAERVVPRIEIEPLEDLPPLELPTANPPLCPTVFVAVGGVAARVLRRLRRRFCDQYGRMSNMPALQLLLLDTDMNTIFEAAQGDKSTALDPNETIALPLRRPQDYRNDSPKLLEWLSRRWLYNIPRSLKTEGLRPLGRLAFVDHAPKVMQKLRSALEAAVNSESLESCEQATGLSFQRGAATVVIVSSISGGTGSGMVIDVAYAARKLLKEMKLEHSELRGILTHSTGRNLSGKELAAVNAYACLSELNHFSRPGGSYPGDAACDLPAFPGGQPAFDQAYVVHLGDDLVDDQLDAASELIASYLYLDAVTPARSFFAMCRQQQEPAVAAGDNAEMKVRTFGLQQISCCQDKILTNAAEQLCSNVVHRWLGGEQATASEPVVGLKLNPAAQVRRSTRSASSQMDTGVEKQAADFAHVLSLDVEEIVKMIDGFAVVELGEDPDSYFRDVLEQLRGSEQEPPSSDARREIVQAIESLLPARDQRQDSDGNTLADAIDSHVKKYIEQQGLAIRKWIFQRLEDQNARARGAQLATKWFADHVRSFEEQVSLARQQVEAEMGQLVKLLTGAGEETRGKGRRKGPEIDVDELLLRYCRLRFRRVAIGAAGRIAFALKGHLSLISDELMDLRRELRHLGESFADALMPSGEHEENETLRRLSDLQNPLAQHFRLRMHELASSLDKQMQDSVLASHGGLKELFTQGGTLRANLPVTLRTAARSTVVRAMKNLDITQLLFQMCDDSKELIRLLRQCLDHAMPRLINCGGGIRLFVMLPEGSPDTRLVDAIRQELEESPSVTGNPDGDIVLCYEIGQMSLTHLATSLIDGRRDYADYAARLHARTDVRWNALLTS